MTNMEIKVLVADDELPARGELKYQLASMPHVNVIGECANGKEVISFLETHPQVDPVSYTHLTLPTTSRV